MSKHTPGPWIFDDVAVRTPRLENSNTESNLIALVYSRYIGEDGSLQANTRLVAASPDLLEALEACEEYFDNRADADCDQDGYIPNEEMKLLTLVRAALSKAGA
jgi:hypothetical protein